RPVGHLFNSITNGIRNMPPYGSQVPAEDRWAIVAYVRALQRSQRTTPEDVPVAERARLGETGEEE
ncbi:MAG: c-type cytochrome, partial [Planctomycetota bacterium]